MRKPRRSRKVIPNRRQRVAPPVVESPVKPGDGLISDQTKQQQQATQEPSPIIRTA